ncbi:MAG: hypothetical protein P8008_01670, partial [Gammaproteobacteria bacterium]
QSSQSMEARTDLELDLGQLVFALGDPIEAAVRTGAATPQAPLSLTLWKAELDPANKTGRFRSVGKWSLEGRDLPARVAEWTIPAPAESGLYRLDLSDGKSRVQAHFVVQNRSASQKSAAD